MRAGGPRPGGADALSVRQPPRAVDPVLPRLAEQLRRSIEGGAWHGPAVLDALDGVTPERAARHPIAGAHCIWELVLHLAATYDIVLRRLDGEARPVTPEEDWPAVPEPTEEAWDAAVARLRAVDAEMRERILRFDTGRLDEPLVPDPPYTAYVQFAGLAEHNTYHAGQMVLLRRAMAG